MTTTTDSAIRDAALALREARAARRPIAPISGTYGIASADAAYAIAELNVQAAVASGLRIVGKKVGLTSKAVQTQLGVDQPDFGVLFDNMEYLDGQDIPTSQLIQPKIEAEVAFVMGADLTGKRPTWAEFLRCVAYALPALEIVDSAIADWKISFVDTVADNASSSLYVLGDQPVSLGALSLGELGMLMTRNGATASVGVGAACLGHPLRAAYWLAQTMGELQQPLRAGEVILSGALGPMVPVTAGDTIRANIGALGSVSCRLV
ncbi:2-keto-4-pentenoate hydratase [Variovorax boronicumulans]|uniref:2-keto-4-pentenoate hydratase n=1 Tax=Variovorax boronicumulans TaxID=436515 RepID=UPI0027894442|nr:fumarylacetoacetate hydrolase family protein [Variovorax boronicumulans]MDP9994580.1 2-keto-4-pentenoate hydratase [Variovorax boronicumulans]MDQ0005721.1 2-keto-4-pentenoate hydratase [Variovorax boronicumulans]MDQ0044356.1 2-keto-4-pentenoate hydratase [Variovorax boronicumulans]